MLDRHEAAAATLDETVLSSDERIDRAILMEHIEQARFSDAVLRDEAWDPLTVVYLLGSGLFGLLAREYAPWSERGASFAARVERLPSVLEAAVEALTGLPDRPVSLLHLDTALAQLPGIGELIGEGLTEARSRAEAGEAPELVARIEAASVTANAALEIFRSRLDVDIRPRAEGEGRTGPSIVRTEAAPHAVERHDPGRAACAGVAAPCHGACGDAPDVPRAVVDVGAGCAAPRGRAG